MMEQSKSCSKLAIILFFIISLSFVISSGHAAGNTFVFNPNTLTWKAINENGKVIRTGKVSGGRKYCADIHRGCKTPAGVYYVHSKVFITAVLAAIRGTGRWLLCPIACFSVAITPFMGLMFTNYNASHGCVRVKPRDAKLVK